jgi:hypothetical protein
MAFTASSYGEEVAEALALDGDGERLMPLVISAPPVSRARELIAGLRLPEAARAGLYCYFDFFEDAHQIAQALPSAEGAFWHAILHRREPDPGNSGYWFRRVGSHAVFAALADEAQRVAPQQFSGEWDPFKFIAFCEDARRSPGSAGERAAIEIQRAEWQLLFDHCMRNE